MPVEQGALGLFTPGETYPIALLNDALFLCQTAAEQARLRSDDGRGLPAPGERAAARACIFTAFNFLESLLIDLTQERIRPPTTLCPHCVDRIGDDLRNARAEISWTLHTWPVLVTGQCVIGKAEFGPFKAIRQLRNELIYPKLDAGPKERSQDELLKLCNAVQAKEILVQICKMAAVLYAAYGKDVPPEVNNVDV